MLVGVAIEASMAFRIWTQLAAKPIDTGYTAAVFTITQDLAAPLEVATGNPPDKTTGVIDYTVLIAMEVYFLAMIVLIVIALIAQKGTGMLAQRSRKPPPFAATVAPEGRRPPMWQLAASPRYPGTLFYLPIHRHNDSAARSMTALAPVKGNTSLR